MNYSSITYPDIENGLGCRVTLWVSGCTHHCKGCQNPETWNFEFGKKYTSEDEQQLFDAVDKPYIKGLTLSGGDPMCNWSCIKILIDNFRNRFGKTKDIWLYTGFTIEQIEQFFPDWNEHKPDVIVEGRYVEALRNINIPFRGSENQRIFDVTGKKPKEIMKL